MTRKISQREARLLKKRVFSLEAMFQNSYAGVNIDYWALNDTQLARVKTANSLGYGLVLHQYSGTNVKVQAVKL